jgi:ribosomal-protein-serine acetyltransferase
MVIKIDSEIELRQLELRDSIDIFEAIDSQRDYLGKWLPFVAFTKEISDTKEFVDSIINAPKEISELVFTIRKQNKFIGLSVLKIPTDPTKRQKSDTGFRRNIRNRELSQDQWRSFVILLSISWI